MLFSMRNLFTTAVFITAFFRSSLALNDSYGGETISSLRRSLKDKSVTCMPLMKEIQYEPGTTAPGPHRVWECETLKTNGKSKILEMENLDSLPDDIKAQFESAETLLTIPGAKIAGNKLKIPTNVKDAKIEKMQNKRDNQRQLLQSGDKKVLVVRVKTTGSLQAEPASTVEQLGDSVFGTLGDSVNLQSQYDNCSHGTLTFSPLDEASNPSLSAPGVYEIEVAVSGTSDDTVREAVRNALPNFAFDYVMYCLPPGTDGNWIAYAYINSKISVYNNEWCTYVSGQMHEVGHNLGLGHAGEGSSDYGDQSGMMGFSYSSDDGPKMCFNAAKSWQLGWYSSKHETVMDLAIPGTSWSGRLAGISDYATTNDPVLVKLETGSSTDYYINFNRKTGINSGTQEGGNQVLITSQGGNGNSYSPSTLLAKLSSGGVYSIANFAGSGEPVTIEITDINTSASPGYADLIIYSNALLPTASPIPSSSPSLQPTQSPTSTPTVFICSFDADCIAPKEEPFFACPTNDAVCDTNTNTCAGVCDCNGVCGAGESKISCPSDCSDSSSLLTTLEENNGSNGNMFDVQASKKVIVTQLHVHLASTSSFDVQVFTKIGGFAGYETDPTAWTLVQAVTLTGQGIGTLTPLPLLDNPIVISEGTTQSFYVQSAGVLRYTNGDSEGSIFVSDDSISILQGAGKSGLFGSTFRPRIWNGRVVYSAVEELSAPSSLPYLSPSSSPSFKPSEEPSTDPSLKPSTEPSSVPSSNPTPQASSNPSVSFEPSSLPSSNPTPEVSSKPSLSYKPSVAPSNKPSQKPSSEPSYLPSDYPSNNPTPDISSKPSLSYKPSVAPSNKPSQKPSSEPSHLPSDSPSNNLTPDVSSKPSLSYKPSVAPSNKPSQKTSSEPSYLPSDYPSNNPTPEVSSKPSLSCKPSVAPSNKPSQKPSSEPSHLPSDSPSNNLTPDVSSKPSLSYKPSVAPSNKPSQKTSSEPSYLPSDSPSNNPTPEVSSKPSLSFRPSGVSSNHPTPDVSSKPSLSHKPSEVPSNEPTIVATPNPVSKSPSASPSESPTVDLSEAPSSSPTKLSQSPSHHPSQSPSLTPSGHPSFLPTTPPTTETTGGTWERISFDDFENGWGTFAHTGLPEGKPDASRITPSNTRQQQYLPRNSAALRIRDNSGVDSSVFQYQDHDVSEYSGLRVSFWYTPRSMERDEGFFLEYSSDGGISWIKLKTFQNDLEFVDDGSVYNDTVDFQNSEEAYVLTNQARIRFRCNASGNGDYIYLDDILWEGYKSS